MKAWIKANWLYVLFVVALIAWAFMPPEPIKYHVYIDGDSVNIVKVDEDDI